MTAEQLRNSILQEAISGRLVPQDSNDEPASVLLERIRKEKETLFSQGVLKKKELLGREIIESETPFPLPIGWIWTKIDNVAFVTKLAGFEYSEYIANNLVSKDSGVPLFKGKNVQNGKIIYDFEAYIPLNLSNELKRSQINKKCLLTPYVGTIGNIGIHDKDGIFHLGSNVGKIEFYNKSNTNILEEYVKYYLMSSYGYDELTKYKKATAQESISIEAIRDVFLPLPPLAEQKRIVAKLEELLPIVEQYGKAQQELDQLNASLPQRLKQSILQEAIQGRLVPQDPNDEPASVLSSSIAAEDIPFEIPESWSWCYLGELIRTISGTSYQKGDVTKDGIRVLRGGNIVADKLVLADDDVFLPETYKSIEKNIRKNDIIIVASTGSKKVIGKPALILESIEDTQIGAFLRIIRPIKQEFTPYLWIIFRSEYYKEHIRDLVKGTNINNIKEEYLTRMLIPLPPLPEQKRIVAKIEELFAEIDKIK